MAYDAKSLETLRRQFHSRSVTFNNFQGITNEDVETLKQIIANKKKYFEAKQSLFSNSGLNNYINTLRYLTNPTISQELSTFDEKVLYLILSCDPELITMKTFISSDILPASRINEEDDKKRKGLEQRRYQELEQYATAVRQELGFYDGSLLKYESILSRRLLKKQGLITDVKIPSLDKLLKRAELIKTLDIITDNSLIRLRSICEMWLNEAKDPADLNSLAYNLINRFKELHIYNIEEQLIIFILIADPNLDLLRIYEEESNFNQMKVRAKNELGFYNKDLIKVERLYHDKFEPEKEISAWTK